MTHPLKEIQRFGQSIWYDNIRRGLITSGELSAMLEEDGLMGVTSNPAIFEKAIAGSPDYDPATKALVAQGVGDAKALFEALAIEDIQLAADVLLPVYERTGGRDGYVSLEVSPYLANDTEGTIAEARRLRAAVGRDNVMIKVPATPAGIPAIEALIGEGTNVNVTLLFAVSAYADVANAYMAGLERFAAAGGDLSRVASVASFFISRIDSLVDEKLSQELDATTDEARRTQLKGLVGKIAIANAKLAYGHYKDLCDSDRWQALAAQGAQTQRLLWASTGTKNPKYPTTLYVDELIGPDTVNTVPAETYSVFKQTGRPRPSLTDNWAESLEAAREALANLASVGISIKEVTEFLLSDGVQKFSDAFDTLLGAVEKKRQALLGGDLARQTASFGDAESDVRTTLEAWRVGGNVRRLWNADKTLWTNADEDQWLGWLHAVDGFADHTEHLEKIVADVKAAGFRHCVLMGMGGSSLCPDLFARTFGKLEGFPQLHVLDSTVPAQVRTIEEAIDIANTIFIVPSKSGGTIEPNMFLQYFLGKVKEVVGEEEAGSRFIAITDPGTKLHQVAKDARFRHIAHGVPSIGGRFSALSNFGMVPAAIMGLDVPDFLHRTEIMVQSCSSVVPPEENPGVSLGIALGTLAKQGRDKVTFVTAPEIGTLGAWLEQLIAESTGKSDTGLIPVDDERVGAPEVYGNDRVFVQLQLQSKPNPDQDAAVDALENAGHPVVRITLEEAMDLGQEMFRWEIATAVVGAVLGINAFNQPDVEAAKVAARKLMTAYEESGSLPAETPILEEGGIALYADERNAAELRSAANGESVEAFLAAHFSRLGAGDYFALNSYVEMNEDNHRALQSLRHTVRDCARVATTLGFGPRFLHSTGQLHKGGPNSGVFLQITSDDAEDLEIPGQRFSFGVLKAAQAQGDFEVLAGRGRRALRVHLGADVGRGLSQLAELVEKLLR